ncbi:ferredoxin reductase domain-containing protein [Salinivirga cyanobacteriivorans]
MAVPGGNIHYERSGYFISGGPGVKPFISILRKREKEHKFEDITLIYSNKEEKDIILGILLRQMLGLKFINTLNREKNDHYFQSRIIKILFCKNRLKISQRNLCLWHNGNHQ